MIPPEFPARLAAWPTGHARRRYGGATWGTTLTRSADGRRLWLYAEELGGTGRVSFNFYDTAAGPALRPCEMPADAVIAFVLEAEPDQGAGSSPGSRGGT